MFPRSRESIKKDQESISPHETQSLVGSLTQPELVEWLGGGIRVLKQGLVVGVRAEGQVVGRNGSGVDSRVWE